MPEFELWIRACHSLRMQSNPYALPVPVVLPQKTLFNVNLIWRLWRS